MKTIILTLVALVLIGCPASTPRPAPVIPTDTASCPSACQHLRDLGCPEGTPIPNPDHPEDRSLASTCEQFCQDTQEAGHALQPSCVMRVRKCSDMQTVQNSNICPL